MTDRAAERLTKLLLMLSSDRDGEVVAAARALGRTLKDTGADWHDFAARLSAPAKAYSSHRATRAAHPNNGAAGNWHAMHEFGAVALARTRIRYKPRQLARRSDGETNGMAERNPRADAPSCSMTNH